MNILNELTKKYLILNKKRTIVTIIGIILSGAMISAVTTLAVSFQSFMINIEKGMSGCWEAEFSDVKLSDIKYIENNAKFIDSFIMADVGLGKNTYSDDQYIRIRQYSKKALENMGETLVEGEFPKTSDEILLSTSFFDGKENEPNIGDTVTFQIGKRMLDGEERIYEPIIEGEEEWIESGETKTYTVCGKIKRPRFENYSNPYTAGITLLNEDTLNQDSLLDVGVITKNPKDIYKDTKELADQLGLYYDISSTENNELYRSYKVDYNTNVLMYMGISDNNGFFAMMYSVCGILIFVIAVGSILVIYNSFAISVSERKKQFGMLSSVGATKKQIRKSVIFEGLILALIGIPLGLLSGVIGIGITLKIVNNLLKPLINLNNMSWDLELVVSVPSLILAAVLILITIYLSVIIPARRASKITPIDAIRQTDDIKIKPRKLKTFKIIRKLFKVEGDIAMKNLKRSKKRYRTTVVSLIISIVLFISVSGFVGYMGKGFENIYMAPDYDINLGLNRNMDTVNENKINEFLEDSLKLNNLNEGTAVKVYNTVIDLPEDKINNDLKKMLEDEESGLYNRYDKKDGNYKISTNVVKLDNNTLQQYLRQIGIDSLNNNQVIVIDYVNMLSSIQKEYNTTKYKEGDIIKIKEFSNIENVAIQEFIIKKVTDKIPFGLKDMNYGIILIASEEGFNNTIKLQKNPYIINSVFLSAKKGEIDLLRQEIKLLEEKYKTEEIFVSDVAEQLQMQKNLNMIISIFMYGFITLISAIGIANIFNTISTNVTLRRREFANLKSIGMTNKQFKKMLNLECFFYGTKALLYGLPLGIFICYLINKAFGNLVTFLFFIPWHSVIISIIAVYVVVFITMIYSSKRVKRENIIDVIRDDNI